MIFIELDVETRINQIEDIDTRNSLMELKASTEALSVLLNTTKYVSNNYFEQNQYVCQIMEKN